jgi:hypothetical protein
MSTVTSQDSTFQFPSNSAGYVAIGAALVTGVVHLLLASRLGLSNTFGVLFIFNGLGFLGGTVIFLTQYWRRELHLVAAGYALVTIAAFFATGAAWSPFAVVTKVAEAVFSVAVLYLYKQ